MAPGVWWAFARSGFRRQSSYGLATLAGAFTNSVFGLVKCSIVVAAVKAGGGSLRGYSLNDAIAYAWVSQAMIAPVFVFAWLDLAQRVRTGEIAIDLARPVDLQLSWLASDLGRAAFAFLPRGVPPVLAGLIFYRFRLSAEPLSYLLGLASLILAVTVSFAWRFLINLTAFWLVEVRGVIYGANFVSTLCNGLALPLALFPGWLRSIAYATPFPSMIMAPVDLLTGRVSGAAAWSTLGMQLIWAVVILALGRWAMARGLRKVVVQGG